MPQRPPPLPLGVVLPTLDALAHLPAHLQALGTWLERAAEVVVVDSESTDGTPDWLRRHLVHAGLRFLSHSRGLYASWNAAIQQVHSEYLTIATVGDELTLAGVEHLYEVAVRFEADVVLSPPAFVPAGGEAPTPVWPIHALLSGLRIEEPTLLSPHDAFWLQLQAKGYALLGSSASNLYRTACLQARPFPTDCGRSGDAAWGLRHAHAVRIAVTPRVISTFLLHARPAPDQGRLDAVLAQAVDDVLAAGRRADLDLPRLAGLQRLLRHVAACEVRKARAKTQLEPRTGCGLVARLGREARTARARRDRMRRLRKRLILGIEATCQGALPAGAGGLSGWL